MSPWQLENPFQDVCIRPVVSASPFPGESPDKRGEELENSFQESAQVRTTQVAPSEVQRRFAWGDGPSPRMLTGSTTSSTPRRQDSEAHSDGKATVCRSKANLFSLLHDTLPTGPVTLDMIVVRRDRPSTPTLKRTPRPAPDFRQTEDWQRAKEAQLRRGLQVPEKKLEQRPGLRPVSRQRRQHSEDKQPHKSCSASHADVEGARLQAVIANIKSQPEDELRHATCLGRRPATPATGITSRLELQGKGGQGSPVFGRPDPDLLVPWPHEMDGARHSTSFEKFPPWPHEM